jgi:hypothetical protein
MPNAELQNLMTAVAEIKTPQSEGLALAVNAVFRRCGFPTFLGGLQGARTRLYELVLDDNVIREEELGQLGSLLRDLPLFRKLSLSRIFTVRNEGIGERIGDLVRQLLLECLSIAGSGPGLGREAVPIICALLANTKLTRLDISHNKIGDVGLLTLSHLIEASSTLQIVIVEGLALRQVDSLSRFLSACAQHRSLLDVPFPMSDYLELAHGSRSEIEGEIAHLRRQVNDRLAANRYLFSPKITSPLVFRGDPVLTSSLTAVGIAASREYGELQIDHFGSRLVPSDPGWQFVRFSGLEPPIEQMLEMERDPRVREVRLRRAADRGRSAEIRTARGIRLPRDGVESPNAHPQPLRSTQPGAQPPKLGFPPPQPQRPMRQSPRPGSPHSRFQHPPEGLWQNPPANSPGWQDFDFQFMTVWPPSSSDDFLDEALFEERPSKVRDKLI